MKTLTFSQTILTFGLAMSLGSCAGENGFKASQTGAGGVIDTRLTPNLDSNYSWEESQPGNSLTFTPDSLTVFNEYVATHPLNNPTDFRVSFEFTDSGNGRWGGNVALTYRDNGQVFKGSFTTSNPNGNTHNRVSFRNWYTGLPNAEFNQWFNFNGKRVFHGFFQDAYGAIVVVIDGGIDLGDAQGLTNLSGSIWFKNFRLAPAPQYLGGNGEKCWFLLPPSPYECGTFRDGSGRVNTTSALYPGDGYKRLGTFSGLQFERAFNN